MALRETLELDTSRALSDVSRIGAGLEAAADRFGVAITRALDPIRSGVDVPIEADTSGVPGEVEGALDAADSAVPVDADTTTVPGEIEGAVDAADSNVTVTGEAGEVTGTIEGAVDAAASTVSVSADASEVTSAVEGALDAAATTVPISVEESGIGAATQQLGGLESAASGAAGAASLIPPQLSSIVNPATIAAGATAAIGASVISAGIAYNSLEQRSRAAFETLLGSGAEANALMDEIANFAEGSPFPRQVFIEASQQLVGFGVEAQNVVPILSAVQDAVAAVGGGTPEIQQIVDVFARIQSQGRITGDEVQRLGLVGIDALSLLGEQSGTTAEALRADIRSGAVDAETAITGLTEGLTARFGGASENVKNTWVGAVDRVKAAARDLGSAILEPFISKEGGGGALDAANQLADAIRDLIPAAQAFGQAIAPLLERTLTGVEVLIEGVLLLDAAFEDIRPAEQLLGLPGTLEIAAKGLNLLRGEGLNTNAELERMAEQAQATADALFGAVPSIEETGSSFAVMSDSFSAGEQAIANFLTATEGLDFSDKFQSEEVREAFTEIGISIEDLVGFFQQGEAGADAFEAALAQHPDIADAVEAGFTSSAEATGRLGDALRDAQAGFEEASEQQRKFALDTNLVTEAEVAQIEAQARRRGSDSASIDVTRQILALAQQRATAAANVATAEEEAAASAGNTATAAGRQAQQYEALAVAAGLGTLTSQQLAEAAQTLGVDMGQLEGFTDAAAKAVETFVSSAAGQLPSVADAVSSLGDDITPESLIAALEEQLAAMRDFRQDLAGLAVFVGEDVAAAAAQFPPAIAQGLVDGTPEVIEAFRAVTEGVKTETEENKDFLTQLGVTALQEAGVFVDLANAEFEGLNLASPTQREWAAAADAARTNAPGLTQATATGATAAALSFGTNYSVADLAGTETAAAGPAAAGQAGAVAGGASTAGQAGLLGFTQGIGGLPSLAGGVFDQTAGAASGTAGAQAAAGATAGGAAAGGFEEGTANVPSSAGQTFAAGAEAIVGSQRALQSVASAVGVSIAAAFVINLSTGIASGSSNVRGGALSAVNAASFVVPTAASVGSSIGGALGRGIASGIGSTVGDIRDAAARAVNEAEAAARAAADASSPSRLFAELGVDLSEGLARGLASPQSERDVVAAAEALTAAAARATQASQLDGEAVASAAARGATEAVRSTPAVSDGQVTQIVVVPVDRLGEVLPDDISTADVLDAAFLGGRR